MSDSILSSTGGARIGRNTFLSINYSTPLARIELTESKLVIFAGHPHEIALQKIIDVRLSKGLFANGIQILNSQEDVPPLIIFWILGRHAREELKKTILETKARDHRG